MASDPKKTGDPADQDNTTPPASNNHIGRPPKETNDPASGEYSRLMGADEYREWVRQTVSGQIWGRMTAIFSAIGLATIAAIITYVSNMYNTTIDAKISAIDTKITNQLANDTRKLEDQLDKKIPNSVNQELATQIRTNELANKISQEAVDQINANNGIEIALKKLIINQSLKIVDDSDPSQASLRAVALQQILLFGDDSQQTDAITKILVNKDSGDQEFALALQNYPTHQSKIAYMQQLQLLDIVLDRAARPNENFNAESWTALDKLLQQRQAVIEAFAWIRQTKEKKDGLNIVKTIVEHIAKVGEPGAGEQFVEWLESNDSELRGLAQQGLTAKVLSYDPPERDGLVKRITRALAKSGLPHNEFSDYLAQAVLAIHQRDKTTLRQIAESEFSPPKVKTLMSRLLREPEDRAAWSVASTLATERDLERIGDYGQYERNLAAYRFLGSLLDIRGESSDWQKLIEPEIAQSSWTSPGSANLLVNAWVLGLQTSDVSSNSSIDVAAELFVNSHLHSDANLLRYNTSSYKFLMRRAGESIVNKLVDNAPKIIGKIESGNREDKDEIDRNEAVILAEALTRTVRAGVSVDRLKHIRASFEDGEIGAISERSTAIWFSAVAQSSGIPEIQYATPIWNNYYKILSSLVAKLKKADVGSSDDSRLTLQSPTGIRSPANAQGDDFQTSSLRLLFIATNKNFLRSAAILNGVQRANLHCLADDITRSKSETPTPNAGAVPEQTAGQPTVSVAPLDETGDLARIIQTDVRAAWFDLEEDKATPVDAGSASLTSEAWLAFVPKSNQKIRLEIRPAVEAGYVVVDSTEHVIDAAAIKPQSAEKEPVILYISNADSKREFFRLSLSAPVQSAMVRLEFQRVRPAAELVPAAKGTMTEIKPGESAAVGTNGDDEAWFVLNVKANKTYVLRTNGLQSAKADNDVDTVIEVYDTSERRKLMEDDDGGEDVGGEKLSSRLMLKPNQDTSYHVRVVNIGGRGTFNIDVVEQPAS